MTTDPATLDTTPLPSGRAAGPRLDLPQGIDAASCSSPRRLRAIEHHATRRMLRGAEVLGWAILPSPPDSLPGRRGLARRRVSQSGGFRAPRESRGHRGSWSRPCPRRNPADLRRAFARPARSAGRGGPPSSGACRRPLQRLRQGQLESRRSRVQSIPFHSFLRASVSPLSVRTGVACVSVGSCRAWALTSGVERPGGRGWSGRGRIGRVASQQPRTAATLGHPGGEGSIFPCAAHCIDPDLRRTSVTRANTDDPRCPPSMSLRSCCSCCPGCAAAPLEKASAISPPGPANSRSCCPARTTTRGRPPRRTAGARH